MENREDGKRPSRGSYLRNLIQMYVSPLSPTKTRILPKRSIYGITRDDSGDGVGVVFVFTPDANGEYRLFDTKGWKTNALCPLSINFKTERGQKIGFCFAAVDEIEREVRASSQNKKTLTEKIEMHTFYVTERDIHVDIVLEEVSLLPLFCTHAFRFAFCVYCT
jgi:hypothetical protein